MRTPGGEHPTLRAFAIILAIVAVVMVFQLYATLIVASALLQIAFFLAIAQLSFDLSAHAQDIVARHRRPELAVYPHQSPSTA